ncbi:MAG: chromosome segregation protein SMC [Clostridia bacterium]|nr:chromosome segregation protein SMC [Clostridia bacterium]
MYLKNIEIYAFKSFADRVKLNFEPGITAIVGPNGSGKSNITDAIRWVLGEQSAKTLRGIKMEDVIFNGSQKRRPLGFAEVSIVIDNSDEKLPIEYTEVKITRKIYRTGESEYLINKVPCRLKDINELLANTGIGRDGYSIIGQGRIDEILSSNPEERRYVFEEAAGIAKYKMRKVESERKLEKTNQNLIRLQDILHEIGMRLGPLKAQAQKAKGYIQLSERLKKYEINLFLMDFEIANNILDKYEHQSNLINNDIIKYQKMLQQKKEYVENIDEEIYKLNSSVERLREHIYRQKSEIQKINNQHDLKTQEKSACHNEKERLCDELKKLQSDLNQRIKQKQEKQTVLAQLSEKLDSYLQEKERIDKDITVYEGDIIEKEDNINRSRDQYIKLLNKIGDIKNDIERYKAIKGDLLKRESQINFMVQNQNDDVQKIIKTISRLERKISDKNSLLVNNEKSLEETVALINQEKQILLKYMEELKEIDNRIQFLNSRRKLLKEMEDSYQGYAAPVKSILENRNRQNLALKGIYGAVGNLISAPQELEIAIETALGYSIQCIVTHREEDARRAIEFLKNNKGGRATFLPLTSIKERELNSNEKNALNMPGCIGIASKLVDYDEKFKPIFKNLLGRVVVVDEIRNGIAIAKTFGYSFKIVTLDGDVLNTGGSISGGSRSAKTSNILGRKRQIDDIEEALKGLNLKKQKKSEAIDQANFYIHDIGQKIEVLKKAQQDLIIEINDLNNKKIAEKEKLEGIQKEIYKNNLELEQINDNKKELEKSLGELNDKLEKIQLESDNIKDEIELFKNTYNKSREDREKLYKHLTEIRIKISSLSSEKSLILENVENLAHDQNELENSIKTKEKLRDQAKEQIERLEKDIKQCGVQMENAERNLKESERNLEKAQKELIQISEKAKISTQEMEDNEQILDKLKEDKNNLELKIVKTKTQKENLQERIWDEYQVSYMQAKDYYDKNLSRPYVIDNIKECKQAIGCMGQVNPGAIDEYKELKVRYDFLSSQKTDLEKAKRDLEGIISSTVKSMENKFIREFKEINTNFNMIFKQLFNGGKAELKLADKTDVLNSGVEIIVQPPGKKLQSISLLSGGERTLTAIAILFAILKLNPAPFCVLDEIEAALDDMNVEYFNRFLKKFSEDIQFIMVTHNKKTMESADVLYGISMQEKGVSKIISLKLDEKVS